jgi:hypothetical protein
MRCFVQSPRAISRAVVGGMQRTSWSVALRLALRGRQLLIASLGQFFRNRGQMAEQAGGLFVGAGGEVDLREGCMVGVKIAGADISGAQRPDALNGERIRAEISARRCREI